MAAPISAPIPPRWSSGDGVSDPPSPSVITPGASKEMSLLRFSVEASRVVVVPPRGVSLATSRLIRLTHVSSASTHRGRVFSPSSGSATVVVSGCVSAIAISDISTAITMAIPVPSRRSDGVTAI